MKPILTYELAMSAARDAANRQMRANGRKAWNRDDYNAACIEFARLSGGADLPGEREYEAMRQAQISLRAAKRRIDAEKWPHTAILIDAGTEKLEAVLAKYRKEPKP